VNQLQKVTPKEVEEYLNELQKLSSYFVQKFDYKGATTKIRLLNEAIEKDPESFDKGIDFVTTDKLENTIKSVGDKYKGGLFGIKFAKLFKDYSQDPDSFKSTHGIS
jgi:hypothetical protein